MRTLAWDVGIKNLSFCLLEEGDPLKILEWGIIDISSGKKKQGQVEMRTKLIEELDRQRDRLFHQDMVVLIENQPVLKNPVMKAVSCCLFDYFVMRGKIDTAIVQDVQFASPVNKLRLGILTAEELESIRVKSSYLRNKRIATLTCEKLLGNQAGGSKIQEFYKYKKRDDLADSFLLAYHYIRKCTSSISSGEEASPGGSSRRGKKRTYAAPTSADGSSPGETPTPPSPTPCGTTSITADS